MHVCGQYLTLYSVNMTYNLKKSIVQWESVCICICLRPRRGSLSAQGVLLWCYYTSASLLKPFAIGIIFFAQICIKGEEKNINAFFLFFFVCVFFFVFFLCFFFCCCFFSF